MNPLNRFLCVKHPHASHSDLEVWVRGLGWGVIYRWNAMWYKRRGEERRGNERRGEGREGYEKKGEDRKR